MSKTLADPSNDKLTIKDLYEQGSKCCQQYSQLTMQIRTLAQHIMIAYAVGIGIFLTQRTPSGPAPGLVFFGAGIILILFGSVLCLLNLHHSLAFRVIRDRCLIKLEEKFVGSLKLEKEILGPWQAHAVERSGHWLSSKFAWYSPFVALDLIGVTSLFLGAYLTWNAYILIAASLLTLLAGCVIVVAVATERLKNKNQDTQTDALDQPSSLCARDQTGEERNREEAHHRDKVNVPDQS